MNVQRRILSLAAIAFLLAAGSSAQQTKTVVPAKLAVATEDCSIRPFHINVPEEQLVDLRRRIDATKWPDKELVSDATQGVQLATMQKLAHYWATDYDWRKEEAKLNALPQFVTTIDGVDIQFIHVRAWVSGQVAVQCPPVDGKDIDASDERGRHLAVSVSISLQKDMLLNNWEAWVHNPEVQF